MRSKLAWHGHTRPDLVATANILSNDTGKLLNADNIGHITEVLDRSRDKGDRGLIQWDLRMHSLTMIAFKESSFATDKSTSTLLYNILLLVDDTCRANVLRYSRNK